MQRAICQVFAGHTNRPARILMNIRAGNIFDMGAANQRTQVMRLKPSQKFRAQIRPLVMMRVCVQRPISTA